MSLAINKLDDGGVPEYDDIGLVSPDLPGKHDLHANINDEAALLRLLRLDSQRGVAIKQSEQWVRTHGRGSAALQQAARGANGKYFAFYEKLMTRFPNLDARVSRHVFDVRPPALQSSLEKANTSIIPGMQMGIVGAAMEVLTYPESDYFPDDATRNLNGGVDARFPEALARYGGVAVIPHAVPVESARKLVEHLGQCHALFPTALKVFATTRVEDVNRMLLGQSHDAIAIVTDEGGAGIGIVNRKDFAQSHAKLTDPVLKYMVPWAQVIFAHARDIPDGLTALQFMEEKRIHALPIVGSNGEVNHVLTETQAAYATVLPPTIYKGGLGVIFAAGMNVNSDAHERIPQLLNAGAAGFIKETAHASRRDVLREAREERLAHPNTVMGFGTFINHELIAQLDTMGIDFAKVGVGGGRHCKTTAVTGVQMSPWWIARESGIHAEALGGNIEVMGDGGMDTTRRVVLMLANTRVSLAQVGTWFMPTRESAAFTHIECGQGKSEFDMDIPWTKRGRGEASAEADQLRAQRRNGGQMRDPVRRLIGWYDEGHNGTVLKPGEDRQTVPAILWAIKRALQSAGTYANATNMKQLWERIRVQRYSR